MTITSSKLADKYQGRSIEAMIAIATAHKNRSLKEFEKALNTYQDGNIYTFKIIEIIIIIINK